MSGWLEKEYCEYCEENKVIEVCNKCGEGVCGNEMCCIKFPHYYNSNYIICQGCDTKINEKLIVLIDYNKLKLIKEKIRNNIKPIVMAFPVE